MRLKPKSHKGKNVLKRWGDKWRLREIRQGNLFIFAESDKTGSLSGFDDLPDSIRWIKKEGDPDFHIIDE